MLRFTVGGGDVMLRVLVKKNKRSYVYDHAGGHLISERVEHNDLDGKDVDFGARKRIAEN